MGNNALASGNFSVAIGQNARATGVYAQAFGQNTAASGMNSTTFGRGTTASNNSSTAFGDGTTASGQYATAFGNLTTAAGAASLAVGEGTRAGSFSEIALGTYNTTYAVNSSAAFNGNDRMLTVGIGTAPASLDDAFIIYKNGFSTIGSEFANPTTAVGLEVNGALALAAGATANVSGGSTITVGNRSFIRCNPSAPSTVSLSNGLEDGQVLVLLNISSTTGANVRLNDAANLEVPSTNINIGFNDTASFIWDASRNMWICTAYSDN
jgi:hypothetical protein